MLRDCDHTFNVWDRVLPAQIRRDFFSVNIRRWILPNLSQNVVGESWSVTFGVTCWLLWTWRNKRVFYANFVYPSSSDHIINKWVEWITNVKPEFFHPLHVKSQADKPLIRWIPPPLGWIKANSDGVVNSTTRTAACGSLLRDFDGRWRGGFAKKVGSCGVLSAELWGICEILKLAWSSGFRYILLESDSKVAVDLVIKGLKFGEMRGGGLKISSLILNIFIIVFK